MTDTPPKKIYDCFIFYNELDLLELRLNELYEVVDYFVICEANVTFRGEQKPLVFADNRDRFAAFADKIIHLIIDDMPSDGTTWGREHHQRNALRRALVGLNPNDVVIISDADEIIRASAIGFLRNNEGYFLLEMDMYQFYLNMFACGWFKPFAYTWKLDEKVGDYNVARDGEAKTLERFPGNHHRVGHAMWHFTFLGGAEKVRSKLAAYSHAEEWQRGMLMPNAAERQLSVLMDVGGGALLRYCPIDESFPKFVRDNLSTFIEGGLVKPGGVRLRELEDELFRFIVLKKQRDQREAYKDAELAGTRRAGFTGNLALGKPATVSSVAHWLRNQNREEEAGRANNGQLLNVGNWAFHTDLEEGPWWQVDLQGEFDVQEVVIFNWEENSARLRHFSLLKSFDGQNWEICFKKSDESVFDKEPYIARLNPRERMRFLRVRLDGHNYLHFRQCLVFGESAPVISEAAIVVPAIVDDEVGTVEPTELLGPEPVRLVVWDLDETFWKGTVSEGGLKQYVRAHHDIVIELAKRGIISSICSKNDEERIQKILYATGILDYFVLPSISWDPKGPRLQGLIDDIQLRPASVMFIDDNPSNRAEAAAMVPSLQIEDETFIARMLDDPRFAGKDDSKLTRLAQYKLLESRKNDEKRAGGGGNEDFLRGCDVRVEIEYDVLPHIDRAIELINRTNQLNFTKRRLPEKTEEARAELSKLIAYRDRQAGLVRVVDKYGDYGFVGFFVLENRTFDVANGRMYQELLHYCFSCRTLGMLVERWLYDWLGRPTIEISGEVLTNLDSPQTVDWIRIEQAGVAKTESLTKVAPEIRIHGGCETASIAHYLKPYAGSVAVTGNFFASASFIRVNGASLLISACDRAGPEFQQEAAALDIPYDTLISRYFDPAPEGTVFIFGGQYDGASPNRYRHKIYGWEMRIEPYSFEPFDLTVMPDDEVAQRLAKLNEGPEKNAEIASIVHHIRENYEGVQCPDGDAMAEALRALISRIPIGSKLLLMLDDPRERGDNGVQSHDWITRYGERVRAVAAEYPFVAVVSFADWIQDESEIHYGGNHYDRMVYYRMAEAMIVAIKQLPGRAA